MESFGERLLEMSTLFSGNTARDHFLNVSKPDEVYLEGEKEIYIDSHKYISGRVYLVSTEGSVEVAGASGGIDIMETSGSIVPRSIDGDIE